MKIKELEGEIFQQFDSEVNVPLFNKEDYEDRIEGLLNLTKAKDFSHIIIYGDREHFSNMHYLTGYDPRFEEALLILRRDDIPILVVGNEGLSYVDLSPLEFKKELYQSFSLMGQPRDRIKNLKNIFLEAGIKSNSEVGIVGWKFFIEKETKNPNYQIDVPYYIVRSIMDLVGKNNIKNATDLMLHPEYGIRIKLDWKDLVFHEIAGTKSSQKVSNVIQHLKPGITEVEASRYLELDGEPVAAHPNINFGKRNVLLGVASPSYTKRLERGEVINVSLGYRYSMVARTGIFVDNKKEIPPNMEGVVEKLYIPYFKALVRWYESIRIGVTGGEVFKELKRVLGNLSKYGIGLNPGHLIHSDEWTNSIFYEDSPYTISSGMAIQCDIIAFPGDPYIGVHVEDGVLIANKNTRNRIMNKFPKCWKRIDKRRKIMKEVLGINLADEVLPTSNIQAVLFPYMGNRKIILSNC